MTSVYREFIKSSRLQILLIILATVLVYSNIFQNDFVWDDYNFIFEWLDVQRLGSVGDLLAGSLPEAHQHVYRPVRSLIYFLFFQISGQNVLFYHFQSLMTHLINVVLVYLITLKLTKSKIVPFLTSFFFGLHPLHTESVTFITASFDLYGVAFFLSSFYLYLKTQEKTKKILLYLSSVVFAFLAGFANEMTLIIPAVLFLYDLCFRRINKRNLIQKIIVYGIYLLPLVSYLIIRFALLRINAKFVYPAGDFYQTSLIMTGALVKYLNLHLLPFGQTVVHAINGQYVPPLSQSNFVKQSLLEPGIIQNLIILAATVFLASKSFKTKPLITFSLGWFYLSLITVANIFPNHTFMTERYTYIASLGFCLLLSYFLVEVMHPLLKSLKIPSSNSLSLIAIWGLLIFYGGLTFARNLDWRDNLSLWSDTVRETPVSSVAHAKLAIALEDIRAVRGAMSEYKKAIALSPNEFTAHNNLARIYFNRGEYQLAQEEALKALEAKPNFFYSHYNLALIYEKQGLRSLAESEFGKALEIRPDSLAAKEKIASFKQD